MDIENYNFRYNAYKNNTFNLKVVEETLDESKMNAYQYLRQFQLDSTGYKRFDFGMQDIYRTNNVNHKVIYVPRRWLFYIEHDFINVGKRLAYKRSDVYEKDLSYDDIITRTNLFDSTFLVFINGTLYTKGIKLLCKEDKTYIVFNCKEEPAVDGFTIADMRNYIETNAKVSIIFIPNVGITSINTNAYRVKQSNNDKGIAYRLLNLAEQANYDNNVLAYITNKSTLNSTPTNVNFGGTGLYVDKYTVQDIIDTNPKNTAMNIQLIPLRHLFTKVTIGMGDKWFKLPIQDYPIAVENCLVFDNEGNFIHDAKVKHYYPNVYSVENIDEIINIKEICIYVFYYKTTQHILKHQNMIEVYHKYIPNYLDKYREGTIIELLKNFEPNIVDYNIKDFVRSPEYNDHFKYKIEKMKEFIRADVNNFRRYLRNLKLGNNYYYVDVSKVDLESKRRSNNVDTGLDYKEFDQDMYMFVFRNDFKGMYDKLLIHVDGLRYETINFFGNEKYDFLYIPCDLVKEDTIIEVEKLTEVMKKYEFTPITNSEIISIDIGEYAVRNKTLYNDLFIVDKETSEYIDPDRYQIIFPIELSIEDNVSDVKLDYLIADSSYFYLSGLEDGKVQLIQQETIEPDDVIGYIKTDDDVTDDLYQLEIEDTDVDFDECEEDGGIIKYIKSQDGNNADYMFRIRNGKVFVEVVYNEDNKNKAVVAQPGNVIIDLGEVFLRCARQVKIRIVDNTLMGRPLELHIKKNFRIAAVNIQEGTDVFQPIKFTAEVKNDSRYFRIYRNGRLIPRHMGNVRFPMDYEYGELQVFPGFTRTDEDHVIVEIMPYMMNQVCYLESIPKDKVVDLTGMIDKPFDFKWYEIYLNGRKLTKKDVEIISANKIKILKSNSLRWLEIVENSRDKEYFGHKPVYDIIDSLFELDEEFANAVNGSIKDLEDIEEPVIEQIISMLEYLLRYFYDNYMIPELGLINPDELQLSRYTIKYYNPLISEEKEKPFMLSGDIGKINAELILPVNPDSE